MAAVLALAVVLIWPPDNRWPAALFDNGAQLTPHGHHAHTEENGQHRILPVNLDADCEASAIGCCAMTHCYPGILVVPHDLSLFAGNGATAAAFVVRGTGSDPGMMLPPPRRFSV